MFAATRLVIRKFDKFTINILVRGVKRWGCDADFVLEYDKQVMYPVGKFARYPRPIWNAKIEPKEVQVYNMVVNFGPAHPAAHGVLRLVTHLQGEVGILKRNRIVGVNNFVVFRLYSV